jgi:GGDEF domain-containing protein
MMGSVRNKSAENRLVDSMRRHGIPPTPENRTLWSVYLSGGNLHLSRTVDVLVSNGFALDEAALQDLYTSFISPANPGSAKPVGKSFKAMLRKLAGDAMNSGDPLALLRIDVAGAKRAEALEQVEGALKKTLSDPDLVSRCKRGMLAVLLPDTAAPQAKTVAEKLRRKARPANVSVGVACYEPGDPVDDWIERADAALREAKNEGSTRV